MITKLAFFPLEKKTFRNCLLNFRWLLKGVHTIGVLQKGITFKGCLFQSLPTELEFSEIPYQGMTVLFPPEDFKSFPPSAPGFLTLYSFHVSSIGIPPTKLKGRKEDNNENFKKNFKWDIIFKALKLAAKKEKGRKKDILKYFTEKLHIDEDEAEELLKALELLGYIANGVHKNEKGEYEQTWKITRRGLREVSPFWKLLLTKVKDFATK
jgi:hypothetical protein